jgi:hypothetical protein
MNNATAGNEEMDELRKRIEMSGVRRAVSGGAGGDL